MVAARRAAWPVVLGLAWLAVLGCSSVPSHPDDEDLGGDFSGQQAAAHSEALAGLLPRLPGSRSDESARAYLRRELELTGAIVRDAPDADQIHLLAELSGRSPDRVLLVAPYPTLASAAWVDDSAAALLLELARVFALRPRPYTLQFALAETRPGRQPASADDERRWRALDSRAEARFRVSEAGRSLLRAMKDSGSEELGALRAVITFELRAGSDLTIARDLRSQPVFRGMFWDSASALGFETTFPPDGEWTSPLGLQTGFQERSIDGLLALVDERVARFDRTPEIDSDAQESASPAALGSVGLVSVDALERLMHRFAKIDAFAPAPAPAPAPQPPAAPRPASS